MMNMFGILRIFRDKEECLGQCVEQFSMEHPYVVFGASFIIMPLLLLLTVSLLSVTIILPFSLLCGWC